MRTLCWLTVAVIVGFSLLGCSDGPKVVKVAGVVTYKGDPVPGLTIQFQPEKGRPSNGRTNDQGRFVLDFDPQTKGALLGNHTVSAVFIPGGAEEEFGNKKRHPAIEPITKKYGDMMKSPYKVEIKGPVDNLEIKFD